jgi:hypothetical protein
MTLANCPHEWGTSAFEVTGNELDWAKMYWDFIADRQGNMATYMSAEHAITNWNLSGGVDDGHQNVIDVIVTSLAAISPTQRTNLGKSLGGNIFDGTAQ